MKRVKIMVLGITLVAAVGGALAFKAAKFNGKVVWTQKDASGNCTVSITAFTLTTIDPGTPKIDVTSVQNGACQFTYTKAVTN